MCVIRIAHRQVITSFDIVAVCASRCLDKFAVVVGTDGFYSYDEHDAANAQSDARG